MKFNEINSLWCPKKLNLELFSHSILNFREIFSPSCEPTAIRRQLDDVVLPLLA
jgi:hypothetical protein